jgi:hypothetical protein
MMPGMDLSLTHIIAVLAGLAIIASYLVISRKGLFASLAAAVTLASAGAALVTVARAFG